MGIWYKKTREKPDAHVHSLQRSVEFGDDIIVGDRYQCECGKVFEVNYVGHYPDATTINWKIVHAYGVMEDTRLLP